MIGTVIVAVLGVAYLVGLFVGMRGPFTRRENRSQGGQDRKFAFRDGHFVNRVSGEKIPLDEPVIIFRARDRHALPVLGYYFGLVEDPHHLDVIRERIGDFQRYTAEHPERMKEPGITHDYRLRDGCGWLGCETWTPACGDCHGRRRGPPRELQLGKHMEVPSPIGEECDLCHGTGKNTSSQSWPACRACGGHGYLVPPAPPQP